jgi:hypothetical protein
MKWVLIVIFAALLLPLGVLIVHRFVYATEYAPGYSEKVFKAIKAGDTAAHVRKVLGEPLSESGWSSGATIWSYTGPRRAHLFNERVVQFTNDVVVSTVSGFSNR